MMNNIHNKACCNCIYGGPGKNVCDKGTSIWDDVVYWTCSCSQFKSIHSNEIRLEKLIRILR